MLKNLVQETTDYGQFKTIIGNRGVNENHLADLVKEVEMNNLLSVQPIIVNEKGEVIDGQHRLEVAKKLRTPIYYVTVPGLSVKHLVRLNNSQRKWKTIDFVNLHCALGNQNYIELRNFSEKNKLSIPISVLLISARGNLTIGKASFKEGGYEISDLDRGQELFEIGNELSKFFRSAGIRANDSFWAALKGTDLTLSEQGLSINSLVEGVKKQGAVIDWEEQVVNYKKFFEDILYKERIKVRLI